MRSICLEWNGFAARVPINKMLSLFRLICVTCLKLAAHAAVLLMYRRAACLPAAHRGSPARRYALGWRSPVTCGCAAETCR